MQVASDLLISCRPAQWLKNLVVFAGIIFAQKLNDSVSLRRSLVAFGLFCLLSSAVYLLNDLVDIEEDRAHPRKRRRPIAAGRVHRWAAASAAAALALLGVACAWLLSSEFLACVAAYLIVTVAYDFWLQHAVILDVLAVAFGFVIRAVAGAVAIEVSISPWLLVCTTLLALFLVLAKRRQELTALGDTAAAHRSVLAHYSREFIDQMTTIVAAATITGYSLYTMWPDTVAKFGHRAHYLPLTVPFVLFGLFRYLYLVHLQGAGDRPERVLLTDPPLIVNLALYLAAAVAILYF